MNHYQQSSVSVGNERIGIEMIASSLVVIVSAVAVILYQQKVDDLQQGILVKG